MAFSAELGLLGSLGIIDRNGITIQKGGFTRITLLLQDHPNADLLCFVREHVQKTCMRKLSKLLIVFLSQRDFLLPERIFSQDQRTDPLLDQHVNNSTACRVQIGVHTASSLRRHGAQAMRGMLDFGEKAGKWARCFLYPWFSLFKGRPLTRSGPNPGLLEVSAARVSTPGSRAATHSWVTSACSSGCS